ncbi:MAG: S53 family peptidase [Sulfobacillus sp.]
MIHDIMHGHLLSEVGEGWRPARPERVIRGTIVFLPAAPAAVEAAISRQAAGAPPLSKAAVDQLMAPAHAAVQRTLAYLERSGLKVSNWAFPGLTADFSGPVRAVERAFSCGMLEASRDGLTLYRNRGEPQLPPTLAATVLAVIGLESLTRAKPAFRWPFQHPFPANAGRGFYPDDIISAYNLPDTLSGEGQRLVLMEFSSGFNPGDVNAFWDQHRIMRPTVQVVSVDGTANDGGVAPQDAECTLDLEWAGAIAPGAELVVMQSSAGTSDLSFARSMLMALDQVYGLDPLPGAVSISYGDAESHFPKRALMAWDLLVSRLSLAGCTVLAASGDRGAYGEAGPGRPYPHVDAPASLPHLVAVGGTTLTLTADLQRKTETGWSDTNNNGASGGGVSLMFARPTWQESVNVPLNPVGRYGRGVPDVALNADPDTGYAITFQGQRTVIGGTSASTPITAGLITLINEARTQAGRGPVGFVTPRLYKLGPSAAFHDILEGNNSIPGVSGYRCGPGWDAVTGWGSVDGGRLLDALLS